MELFKNFGMMKITEAKLREMIKQSLNEQLEEGKIGRALAGLGLAATLATSMPSCSYFNHYEPNWEQEGPRSEQEKMTKTWNTHEERGDWDNIKPGVGFIYDCYTRCANSGGGWNIHVIFKDKTTGKFILPQECQEYLYGRYVPNCNCFENEKTTDRVDTNGLQRLSGSENTTVFENKQNTNISKNMKKQTLKLNESQLNQIIRESIKNVLNEWGFPDNMDYNVEYTDTAMDELQKYSDVDVKSSYNPSDIYGAFCNLTETNDNIEFIISIGQALLSEDGLTEKDENRTIEGIKQDYEQVRTRIRNILNGLSKKINQPS